MNIIESILSTIWGHKYYLPIYVLKGTFKTVTSATPYRTRKEVERAALGLESYQLIEIVTFRSKEVYEDGELK